MKFFCRGLALAAVLLVVWSAVWAHDLFIKLDSYFLSTGTSLQVTVLNGTFWNSENAITTERLLDLSLVSGGQRKRLSYDHWKPEGSETLLSLETGGEGTYVAGASTKPRELQLSADDFNAYLEHEGIPDVYASRKRDGELGRAVVERYHKHVKAVMQVGDQRTGDYSTALGYPAELVPLKNPYDLKAGDTVSLRVLVDGSPVANQLVIAGGQRKDGAMAERSARSGDDGAVSFVLGQPGRWYVKFIHMVKSPDVEIDYESKWATVTFEVR